MMFSKTITDSGLRVVTERMPTVQSVAVGVWVCSGVVDEPEDRLGLSHFAEHMLFKGTATRTAAEIAETIDSLGGYLDAFTDREHVCYFAKVLSEHTRTAIDLLGDMVSHSRLAPRDILVEKSVISEEILSCEDSPEEFVMDRFTETIWEGSTLGRKILGTLDTVSRFNRVVLREFLSRTYAPNNLLVSAAGSLDHKQIVQWAERSLRDLRGHSPVSNSNGAPSIQPHQVLIDKDTERVYLCVGTRSFGQDSADKIPAHLLDVVLSGGCSSRLFQEVREKRGLAYSIGSSSSCYGNAGFLAVAASCGVENAKEVLRIICKELRSLKRQGVSEKELERAKQQVRGNLLLATENTGERMIRNAQNEIYFRRLVSIKEVLDQVEKVRVEDLQRVANEVFDDTTMNLVCIGPFGAHDLDLSISVGGKTRAR